MTAQVGGPVELQHRVQRLLRAREHYDGVGEGLRVRYLAHLDGDAVYPVVTEQGPDVSLGALRPKVGDNKFMGRFRTIARNIS